jgi:hypothetical protein
MTFEVRDRTCYDVTVEYARSNIPFDGDPAAMRDLFSSLGEIVLADVETYSNGAYDRDREYGAKQIAMEYAQEMSRPDFEQLAQTERYGVLVIPIGVASEVRRAYDVLETMKIIGTAFDIIPEPMKAWTEALHIATTARFERESQIILWTQKMRGIGNTALQ